MDLNHLSDWDGSFAPTVTQVRELITGCCVDKHGDIISGRLQLTQQEAFHENDAINRKYLDKRLMIRDVNGNILFTDGFSDSPNITLTNQEDPEESGPLKLLFKEYSVGAASEFEFAKILGTFTYTATPYIKKNTNYRMEIRDQFGTVLGTQIIVDLPTEFNPVTFTLEVDLSKARYALKSVNKLRVYAYGSYFDGHTWCAPGTTTLNKLVIAREKYYFDE